MKANFGAYLSQHFPYMKPGPWFLAFWHKVHSVSLGAAGVEDSNVKR